MASPLSAAAVRFDVIIPTLDEAPRIADAVACALKAGAGTVRVVDGGSVDDTAARAARAGALVTHAPRGRGPQMNAGAATSDADVLVFVHADARLPVNAGAAIRRALRPPRTVGGAFRIRTVADDGGGWARHLLWAADVRSRFARLPYGDQAMFVRRATFERVGGFPDQALFEDVELARRLRGEGQLVLADGLVTVSGRRFLAQPLRAAATMWLLPTLYRAGVPADALARLYPTVR